MTSRTPIVAGNWKMNLRLDQAAALARAVDAGTRELAHLQRIIFPASVHLDAVSRALSADPQAGLAVGAQNAWHQPDGAFTGETSIAMLTDLGCAWLLTGHSERRHVLGETDDLVNAKTRAALAGGLSAMLCIGETLEQRERGETDAINAHQLRAGLQGIAESDLARIVIAYEPVWAIGTGKTATPDDAQAAHLAIRGVLAGLYSPAASASMRILYGGSVKPDNAEDLFSQPDIDGGLIGGASLKADSFLPICGAANANRCG